MLLVFEFQSLCDRWSEVLLLVGFRLKTMDSQGVELAITRSDDIPIDELLNELWIDLPNGKIGK
jgi:hypothetical protein